MTKNDVPRLLFVCAALHDYGPTFLVFGIQKEGDNLFKATICPRRIPSQLLEIAYGDTEQESIRAMYLLLRKKLKRKLAKLRKADRVLHEKQEVPS